jgi:3-oxoacyl-[acyl-carrier protein] reductase
MRFAGKTAIVTGASTGIGAAYCLALAAEGANVVAAARTVGKVEDGVPTPASLAEVVLNGRDLPGEIVAQACDVASEQDVSRVVDLAMANYGRIDILVNNAAIFPPKKTFAISPETFDQHMHINARGAYLTIKHAAPHMMRQGSGAIVNLTSDAGTFLRKKDSGHPNLMLYALTKATLNRLTTYMAEELREHGIAVNGLSPGGVGTDSWIAKDAKMVAKWTELGLVKACTPEAVGPPMLWLAAQTADSFTGQIVHDRDFGKAWGAGD